MKILIYGINYRPELTGIGKYSGEMGARLAAVGHEVRVVTAPPYYPGWQVSAGYRSCSYYREQSENESIVRCPLYVPKEPSAIKRILHLGSFSLSSFFPVLWQAAWQPNLVIYVVPTLFCFPQVALLRLFTGARLVLHIQDFEVDAFFQSGIGSGRILRALAMFIERGIYRCFDKVSTISPGMISVGEQKGINRDRLILFPNWSEVDRFQKAVRDTGLLQRLGVEPEKQVVLYSGNLGEKQGLHIIVQAAEALQDNEKVHFLVVGEGAGDRKMREAARKCGLTNITFAPLQPYDDLPNLLASADAHLVVQRAGIADAVLPSKLTNILAVGGNAVVTAESNTTLGELCRDNAGIACLVPPSDLDALIRGVNEVLAWPRRNEVALSYARRFLDKSKILDEFMAAIIPDR